MFEAWEAEKQRATAEAHYLRASGAFPLTGRGKFNTYALFAELMVAIKSPDGRVGCIVPTGVATDLNTSAFFCSLMQSRSLISLEDFENKLRLFPTVAPPQKFCLLTVGPSGSQPKDGADFFFFAHRLQDLEDPNRHFSLTYADVVLLNPTSGNCPIFRSKRDAEIYIRARRRWSVLCNGEEGWPLEFRRMFNMSDDSEHFLTQEQLEATGYERDGNVYTKEKERVLPLYEAKLFHILNHRYNTFKGTTAASRDRVKAHAPSVTDTEAADPSFTALPRYWLHEALLTEKLRGRWEYNWLIAYRRITNVTTNRRTLISAVIPLAAVGHNAPNIFPTDRVPQVAVAVAALFSSFVFDYFARQKVGGADLSYEILSQLPAPSLSELEADTSWLGCSVLAFTKLRLLELVYTSWDLQAFAVDCGCNGPPFVWDPNRRRLLHAEVDAAFFHVYGLTRAEVDHVLEEFPIVKRKDEAEFGSYRTKVQVLNVYDRMQAAMDSGTPYETLLDPPPADPSLCHPPREAAKTGKES